MDSHGYCSGYCTAYVGSRRPDLSYLGNATAWYGAAQAKGISVGTVPVVGAAAWWSGSDRYLNSGGYGHIAYVESVTPTSVTVSEMNYHGWNVKDTRTISLNDPARPQGYIYGGPAGNGPVPPTPPPTTAPPPPTTTSPSPTTTSPSPTTTSQPPPPPVAAHGTVEGTGGIGLNERTGPGPSYAKVGNLPDGTVVNIVCQADGPSETGPWGADALWDKLDNGYYVSDAWVYTGSNGRVAPAC